MTQAHTKARALRASARTRTTPARLTQESRAIHRRSSQWQIIAEALPDAILAINSKGVVEKANAKAIALFGFRREGWMNQPLKKLLSTVTYSQIWPLLEKSFESSASLKAEVELDSDGVKIWLDARTTPLDEQKGATPILLCLLRDITQQKLAQRQLQSEHDRYQSRAEEHEAYLELCHDALQQQIARQHSLERKLIDISEGENQRIGRELHDGLCQQLAGVVCLSGALESQLQAKLLPEAREAGEVTQLLQQCVAEARQLSRNFSPATLESGGLRTALKRLTEQTARMFRVECLFRSNKSAVISDRSVAISLFRFAQEAIHNAIYQGRAQQIQVMLIFGQEKITLSIQDNGRGNGEASKRVSSDLEGLKLRARLMRGSFAFRRAVSGGVTVVCSVPAARTSQSLLEGSQDKGRDEAA